MIGVFDSGHGGLTVLAALQARLPQQDFVYYGDHAHAPYGDRGGTEILALTKAAADTLFRMGCRVVLLACNTATAAAGRTLQQDWLHAAWPGRRLLGIIAPTVEAATQMPWGVVEPVFPQKYNTDLVALFGTSMTVNSGVYATEIAKRCPRMRLVSRACPALVPLIEGGASRAQLADAVNGVVKALLAECPEPPQAAILGCTHYPLAEDLFKAALPPQTRVLSQPVAVANALEDYLHRHADLGLPAGTGTTRYLTSGDPATVNKVAEMMMGRAFDFSAA